MNSTLERTAGHEEVTIHYRLATSDDIPAVTALLESADLPLRELEPFIESFMLGEADGKLVACGGLEIRDDTAVLRSVAVEESMRGSGVGRGLSLRLIGFAISARVSDIYLFTGSAHGFWQRIGFSEITLDDWREQARQSWQWQYVSANREWAESNGLHTMWMPASR